jgi:type IV pilus biogenesis protein CpaD/CtpE
MMQRLKLLLLTVIAALAVACVDAEPDKTTVVVKDGETPAGGTTIVDSEPAPEAPDVDVDVDVKAEEPAPDTVVID